MYTWKPHQFKLPDGREAIIREADAKIDLTALVDFFTHLPAALKNTLRYDVSDPAISAARLQQMDGKNHWRVVAMVDGKIVADGTMDRERFGWTRHIADLRVVVIPEYEEREFGTLITEHLVDLARHTDIERLSFEVLAEQTQMVGVLEGLGFAPEVIRKGYAKGVDGKLHDVIIMSNDLERVWRALEDHLHDLDINYGRITE